MLNYAYVCINIYILCTFMHIYACFCCVCCLPSPHTPIHKGGGLRPPLHKGGRPPSAAAPLCGFLYMVAGEVASIAKTYRRISKYALNMYIDAYISHIPLESLSS